MTLRSGQCCTRTVLLTASFLLTSVLVLATEDAATLKYDELLPAAGDRPRVDSDVPVASEHRERQGRVSLHAEMPSSKAKREQALRNILAARRRQILSQRSHEPPRILSGRAPRPSDERRSKDPPDILETQETRHNVYVTSARTEAPTEEETSQSPKKLIDKVAAASDLGPTKPEVEAQTPKTPRDDNSSSSSPSSPTTSTTITTESYAESVLSTSASAGAKPNDADARRKNTVSMPESLYNHFRPVESNIPVEDMSQFLYFGQKLPADGGPSNNVTGVNGGNNSSNFVETTSAVSSSHRRYSAKRLSALAPGPVEEIVNEEMNIALERRIVEKNQVSRIKNTFRSPGSGLYYRKARPADLVSNMIPGNESSSTLASPDPRGEINTVDKFRADPSAHADQPREQATRQRGSDAHVVEPSTTTTTQIPRQRQLPGVSDDADVDDGLAKSDIDVKSVDLTTVASREEVVESKRKRTGDLEKNVGELGSELKSKGAEVEEEANGTKAEMKTAEKSERKVTTDADVTTATTPRSNARSRDSNSDETSTSSTTADAQTTLLSLLQRAESSTLRIVVPDESFGRSFAIESERTRQDTVKQPVDPAAADRPVRVSAAGDDVAPKSLSTPSTTDSAAAPAVVADTGHRQPQQQHVYAYTITNVTRLLRNYTGSSGEERAGGDGGETGGGRRSSGAEMTSGGPSQRRQQQQQQQSQLQSPLLRPPPSSSSSPLLLPRAGDGIEPARALAGLSAGATIEPAAAAEASSNATAVGLVGERARKVVPQVQQQQQRATSQRATWPAHLGASDSVVISPTRPVKSTEARGFVRWSQVAKSRTSDQEGANDRRFLRKSASAVLNQRSTVHEETASSAPLTSKRRRVLAPQSGLVSPGGRRVKSNDRERSEAARGRVLVTDDRSSGTSRGKSSDDEVSGAAPLREAARVSGLMNEVPRDSSAQETTVTVANTGVTTTVTATTAMVNSSRDEAMDAPADPLTLMDATTTTEADKADVREEEDVVTASSAGDGAARIGGDATLEQTESDVNETSGEVATTATVTEQVGDTTTTMITTTPSSQTSMMATLTTTAAPVFPVTPRILADKTTVREASGPSDDAKPPEANNRSFGSAADLDPTEIQKRYRAKESLTTTTATTITATPTTVSPVRSDTRRPASDASSLPNGGPEAAGASTPALKESGRRVSGERSPEVRARNLSDKSKDKDEDVLPIMHLYNTSDIFNGSGPMEGFARGTDRPRLVLPMGSDANPPAATTTTTKPPGATRKSASEPVEIGSVDGSASTTVPIPKAWEPTASPSGSRKDKQEENRGEASQDTNGAPTASRGASSFAPASGSNRTRYRPSYHPSLLPEYNNGTMYPVGLNRTFLEIGPISVSPRESMNISEVISKPHDGDVIATQETVAVVSYILATLVVFPIAVGVGLILRRLILRNRKVLEESDTSSEISCRKDALNLENGDFKTSIEKAITKLPRIQHLCHEAEKPPPPPTQESRWEFPRDKLRLQTVLGQGNFGQVWKAEADDLTGHQGTTRLVAVKTVKEGASEREKEDLVRELEIMQQLGSHPNVVTLLGCCTEEEPHYLILEYVMYGKLLAYLRDHRTRQYFYNFSEDSAALTSRDLTVFGYCVARGMEYLASKKIIHRDLAARNVLVDHNKLCKIADFGMSRFANEDGEVIETRHGRNALPIRWMAPESLIYSLFTTKTDVWSFGILMWEIVTLGSTPYPDMTAREVMRNVHNGYRLERPSHCRSELFRVISRCWHADPDRRPEFQTLRRDLAQLLEDNMNGHYVDLESFASECTD